MCVTPPELWARFVANTTVFRTSPKPLPIGGFSGPEVSHDPSGKQCPNKGSVTQQL